MKCLVCGSKTKKGVCNNCGLYPTGRHLPENIREAKFYLPDVKNPSMRREMHVYPQGFDTPVDLPSKTERSTVKEKNKWFLLAGIFFLVYVFLQCAMNVLPNLRWLAQKGYIWEATWQTLLEGYNPAFTALGILFMIKSAYPTTFINILIAILFGMLVFIEIEGFIFFVQYIMYHGGLVYYIHTVNLLISLITYAAMMLGVLFPKRLSKVLSCMLIFATIDVLFGLVECFFAWNILMIVLNVLNVISFWFINLFVERGVRNVK